MTEDTMDTGPDRWEARLSEWLDGDLSPAEHADVERHLATCVSCAAIVEDLRALKAEATRLGPIEPASDLWPGILARLESAPAEAADPDVAATPAPVLKLAPRKPRTWTFTAPRLALAASVLIALSGGLTWMAMNSRNPQLAVETNPPIQVAPDGGSGTGATRDPLASRQRANAGGARRPAADPAAGASGIPAMAAGFDVERYEATISELEQVLAAHRAELDTSTVRVIEQNLAIIDGAVDEARRALAADPASRYLNTHLASQLRRKAQLLRQATTLVVPS
jgi:anti-sigma factor RsiW